MVHVNVHQQETGSGLVRYAVSFLHLEKIYMMIYIFYQGTTKAFNQSCSTNQPCDGTLQLICNNNICVCQGSTPYGTWFWNGTQCGLKICKTFFE